MTRIQSALAKGVIITAAAASVLAATAPPASAYVACNRWGECWRVRERYNTFPTQLGVIFHEDTWWDRHRARQFHWRGDHDHDRDGDDHGYWRRGHWRNF